MGVALAPANGVGAGTALIEAGAREVYWGFFDEGWTRRFGQWAFLNRMSPFGTEANSLAFADLLAEIRACRALEDRLALEQPLGLYCTFNSPHYTSEQRRFIAHEYLPALKEAGLSGIIVSQPELLATARDAGLAAVASTMCAVYNEELARFYREEGASRIILPRDLSLAELAAIIAAVEGPSYEVFLMRNGCQYADSHCLGLHRSGCPSLCRSLREAEWWEVPTGACAAEAAAGGMQAPAHIQQRLASGAVYRERFHQVACGQCALWHLEQAGVAAYKVVGRGDARADLLRDVQLTAHNAQVARACASHEEFLQRMQRPAWLRGACADEGLSCYYPEVRAE